MAPGKLTTLARIERATVTKNEVGEDTETWATYITCWVSVQGSVGRELFYARSQNAQVSHVLMTWWQTGVTPRDRVVLEESGRVLHIVAAINVDEQNIVLQLNCTEQA